MTEDERHLRRAIRLCMNGRGRVEPNPMVGCVLVRDGRVIGEGYHTHFGGPHAEPAALASCTESPEGATAYVTLEPCCHTNKKTPPCAPRLIREKVARVVVGCLDPNLEVNGRGLRMLRSAGIQVDGPVLECECRQLIAPFLAMWNQHRPYVTAKWAESADGKVAGPGGVRRRISNPAASRLVHVLRGRSDAIGVGIGTVLSDDPELTVRDVTAARHPTRIVFDSRLRIPEGCRLVRTAKDIETVVFCGDAGGQDAKKERLLKLGVEVTTTQTNAAGSLQLAPALRRMPLRGVSRMVNLLIEPGPRLGRALLTYSLADRIWVFRSPHPVTDVTAPSAPTIPASYIKTGEIDIDGDVLTEFLNPGSDAFFAPVPSADFVLAGR